MVNKDEKKLIVVVSDDQLSLQWQEGQNVKTCCKIDRLED